VLKRPVGSTNPFTQLPQQALDPDQLHDWRCKRLGAAC
jgi:hypothetical protein